MIIVLGQVYIDPSVIDEFLNDIDEIDPSKKNGGGNISYAVAVADPSSGAMLVAERWRDQRSLTGHLNSKRTMAFVEKWSGRMRGDVLKYDASNERALLD